MKKITTILLGLLFVSLPYAQDFNDAQNTEEEQDTQEGAVRRFYSEKKKEHVQKTESWIASGKMGTIVKAELDSLMDGFFITNPAEKQTIALEYLGNLGSPGQSKIFFDRRKKSDFLFFQPYQIYYTPSEEVQYYNTRIPYSLVNYYSGGPSLRKEQRVNGLLAVNVTPSFNFGIYGDWLTGYGVYASQSTKVHNTGFFSSYLGKHHHLMANISLNGFENYENGGLTTPIYVTNPRETGELEAQNMPVFWENNVWSKVNNWNTFLNYKYHIGIEKSVQVTEDSVTNVFIPVTSFIYTFRSERDYKKYYERDLKSGGRLPVDSFYNAKRLNSSLYVNESFTLDSTRFSQMKHTLGIMLNEEYNTLARFGLTGYVTADIKNYTYLDGRNPAKPNEADTLLGYLIHPEYRKERRSKIGVGANLAKHLGEAFTYDFGGEYYLITEKKGAVAYLFEGNIRTKFNLWEQEINLSAQAEYRRDCPDFLEEYYFSNRIKWDTTFLSKDVFSAKGILTLPSFPFYPSFGLTLSAGLQNLNHYIYWDQTAMPKQYNGNIQLVDFTLKQRMKFLRYFHWENAVTWQKTSEPAIIPLPELCWYSNFYFMYEKLFDVLTLQIGADMRYNSRYYAPNYFPATGMFYQQQEHQTGDYPHINAYFNFHLKQARFFIEYNHLNKGWWSNDYLVLPGYALNPNYLKLGVSLYLAD